eukprot:COSAG06_NODE_39711_length_409_cov_1.483871_1_plen_98_part_01
MIVSFCAAHAAGTSGASAKIAAAGHLLSVCSFVWIVQRPSCGQDGLQHMAAAVKLTALALLSLLLTPAPCQAQEAACEDDAAFLDGAGGACAVYQGYG